VDSEHSAVFQCLGSVETAGGDMQGRRKPPAGVRRIILTASGGPFGARPDVDLDKVTVEEALRHPKWRMGRKVTVDSATLMNKGLEVIEAHWLFDMPVENISVVIHPQSIIHSMVEFADGSIKAQMSYPDMRMPIQYALTWPERLPNEQLRKMDWYDMKDLTFSRPDFNTFPCLQLAVEAVNKGGTNPAVLCGADEAAVELFLSRRLGFMDIPRLVGRVLAEHKSKDNPSLTEILEADTQARERVLQLAGGDNK